MRLRLIYPLALLAVQSALAGTDVAEVMRQGEDALQAGIWEVAAGHFSHCLADSTLAATEKTKVGLLLAETMVRAGRYAEALDLLGQSWIGKSPGAAFWHGQALAGMGKFSEAVETLTPLAGTPSSPNHVEAVFTITNLQLALEKPGDAVKTLDALAKSPDTGLSSRARLHQVEILLDLGLTQEARQAMPVPESIRPENQSYATFLEANLLLRENHPADAASAFETLVAQEEGRSQRRYHIAAVGLADALRAAGRAEAATTAILQFIQENPDSPELSALFDRLIQAFPQKPSANDPVLEHLQKQWITSSELPATGLIASSFSCEAPAWQSKPSVANDRLVYSLFARAVGLHRAGTADSMAEAENLVTRIRVEYPEHPLTQRALLESARWELEKGNDPRAFAILDVIRHSTAGPPLVGEAAFLEARAAYDKGERKRAVELFDQAAQTLASDDASLARLNAAIIRLTDPSATAVQAELPTDPGLAADLELERALTRSTPAERRTAIEEFLTKHPGHPREVEARLAAAEAALTGPSPDLSFARAQVDTLAADAENSADPVRLALIQLRIADLAGDSEKAIATARAFLEAHGSDPSASEASLILGRHLFLTQDYNQARLVLETLAAAPVTPPQQSQAAWLLAARAAALVSIDSSNKESLILYDHAINAKGPVASLAKLEKADQLIKMYRLDEAVAFLRDWFESLPTSDPLHLPAGLLLGKATYALGNSRPASLQEALSVYDKLLAHAKNHPALYNQLQYLRGQTLENMADAKDPSRKRTKEALAAYYSVLETATPPAEWEYFEDCGRKALKLLEDAGRWSAAIACAKRIASFNSPNSKEFADHASQLQLEHMIWED